MKRRWVEADGAGQAMGRWFAGLGESRRFEVQERRQTVPLRCARLEEGNANGRKVDDGAFAMKNGGAPWLILEFGELDGFAGAGGFACGVEDLHNDDVGVEPCQIVLGLDLAAEDGGEIVE